MDKDAIGGLYAQCFLIAKSMDSAEHVAALRQAFIDAGVVSEPDLRALEAANVPDSLHKRGEEDRNRKMPVTLGSFHHMFRGIRQFVWVRDPLAGEISRVFRESRMIEEREPDATLKAGFSRWLPEVRSITSGRRV